MEEYMKKHLIAFSFLFVSFSVFAQTIDKSQYKEIDLFSYIVEAKQEGKEYTDKYKMVLKFNNQSGTTLWFRDDANDIFQIETSKRWDFNRGQVVTIYFTARHSGYGWANKVLDAIETSTGSSVKPWLPYVSNGKTGLHGWYLQDMGNGTYKEIYFE
jgi:hypothetical protein